ncbi:unnamed protein product [Cuscuta epithymum]|uniref:FAR1 domain-containing protein n=1 Tax=Cuscuta epithymum TaxID=186058 RepID=A0AAV0CPC8_9ASTE|nr:unnamed protein product [Cuscuta epithymum]
MGDMDASSIPIVGVEDWVNNINTNSTHAVLESRHMPHSNMEFKSEVEAYEYYNAYSKRYGFGIRREYVNRSKKDGILTSRRFSCYKEGMQATYERDNLIKKSESRNLNRMPSTDGNFI